MASLVLALLSDAGASATETGEPVGGGVIVFVRTNNLMVPELRRAEAVAARIFASIGVAVEFRSGAERNSVGDGSVGVALQLDETAPSKVHSGAMASALPFGESGTRIHVFYDRVRKAWRQDGTGVLLGHVMAHEIAHVLQGMNRHSAEGVMKANWAQKDFNQMKAGTLSFDPTSAELIHAALENGEKGATQSNQAGPPR